MKPKCAVCSMPIPVARIYAAKSRGIEPTYCSERCKNTAAARRFRLKASVKK